MNNETCPCCGYMTISETYEICHICGWENDPVQRDNPDITGANRVPLREAQRNFARYGASHDRLIGTDLITPPSVEVRDPNWHPLDD